jgi:hypothetical protein
LLIPSTGNGTDCNGTGGKKEGRRRKGQAEKTGIKLAIQHLNYQKFRISEFITGKIGKMSSFQQ